MSPNNIFFSVPNSSLIHFWYTSILSITLCISASLGVPSTVLLTVPSLFGTLGTLWDTWDTFPVHFGTLGTLIETYDFIVS